MNLLKNPSTYLKAQEEVDQVIGDRSIEVTDLNKLKYLNAVLRETSRLNPTVPVLQKEPNPATANDIVTLGGKYRLEPSDHIVALLSKAQRDPKVWGNDSDEFEPSRMLDENFDKVSAQYPGSWKVRFPCGFTLFTLLTGNSHSETVKEPVSVDPSHGKSLCSS